MEEANPLRKHLDLDALLPRRQQIEDVNYWRSIKPDSAISDCKIAPPASPDSRRQDTAKYAAQLREEGYFQTPPVIPSDMLDEMLACIHAVRDEGFPVMFALVYDVFYAALAHCDFVLAKMLGPDYQLIPNFWVYYIEPSDGGKGFEPHRDAEYANTIEADGMPTVLTLWITVTDATPLNSCMYILPRDRDPQFSAAVHDLKTGASEFALEDIRALPTPAGTLSCWDQYVYHWGSRSSKRAPAPRVSYAMYCQRGDMPPVDNALIDLRQGIDFQTRLGLICKGMYSYSYLSVQSPQARSPLSSFLEQHMAALSIV